MIHINEFFVVQIRPLETKGEWADMAEFEDDGEAFDQADYYRKDGDTEARVVRRWN